MSDIEIKSEYQKIVDDVYGALALSRTVAQDNTAMATNDMSAMDMYYQAEADAYSRLAIAEQQRIANLIAISRINAPDMSHHKRNRWALLEAMEALGVPFDPELP
jgi:hypothetical protein